MDTNAQYQEWQNKLLRHISDNICKPCTDTHKDTHAVNYENPLRCGCRCERVDSILAQAKEINDDLANNAKD